jgi:hypothetical protein
MQSDALDLSPEERKLDKRFPEYWADLARTNLISKMPWIDKIYQPPTHPMDYDYHLKQALAFRKYMDENNKNESCCICGMRKRWREFHIAYDEIGNTGHMLFHKIPSLNLLLADPPDCIRCAEFPRDAKTTYRHHDGKTYCLSKLGMEIPEEGVNQPVMANVCQSCIKSLKKKKIPKASFVRFDAGSYLDIDLRDDKYGMTGYMSMAKNFQMLTRTISPATSTPAIHPMALPPRSWCCT